MSRAARWSHDELFWAELLRVPRHARRAPDDDLFWADLVGEAPRRAVARRRPAGMRIAHFVQPGEWDASSEAWFQAPRGGRPRTYDVVSAQDVVARNLVPNSVWRMTVPLGGSVTIDFVDGEGLTVTSNNPSVIRNPIPETTNGNIRTFTLLGAGVGTTMLEVSTAPGRGSLPLQVRVMDDGTQISQELYDWLRSAANDVAFSNGASINSYFTARTGNTFPAWFRARCGTRGAWADRQLGAGAEVEARFVRIWDRVRDLLNQPSASLLQFVCLTSIFINEVGARLLPNTEIGAGGRDGHVGLAYLFDAIPSTRKRSYNAGGVSNRTAFALFNDPEFIAAHGSLALGAQLANTTDRRWAGTQYPQDVSTSEAFDVTGFIQQADFYKFRGRGFIQTTGRGAYEALIQLIQSYNGADPTIVRYRDAWRDASGRPLPAATIATRSRNADWDDLFQNTNLELPCLAVGLHNRRAGNYMRLANDRATLNGTGAASIYNVGLLVSGGAAYAELFQRRVIQILDTLRAMPAPRP